MALRSNPRIHQAHLEADAARGIALQAGLHPNPLVGYESSSVGQGQGVGLPTTAGQQGGFIEQTIKTAGKLKLARLAAQADVQIAEQNLTQAETDVQARVRAGYFAVLSARENHLVNKTLADLTDEVYNVLLVQLQAGEVAGYEPMQIRVLALQARGQLVQSYNRYTTAWKQLAVALGAPALPLTELAGRIDMPVPHFEQNKVLAQVLSQHTEVISAQFGVDKGRTLLRLAEVQPIPDVTVHVSVQKDYTTPPFGAIANVSVGVPVPFWDRNQGNIQAARSLLQRAMQEQQRVRNDLTGRVAEAFERYDNSRALLQMYKDQMLPNQVQAFRAAVARHAAIDKSVSYNDVVTAQQSLAGLVSSYLTTLSDQWTAVVDIAALLQTSDLFQIQQTDEVAPGSECARAYAAAALSCVAFRGAKGDDRSNVRRSSRYNSPQCAPSSSTDDRPAKPCSTCCKRPFACRARMRCKRCANARSRSAAASVLTPSGASKSDSTSNWQGLAPRAQRHSGSECPTKGRRRRRSPGRSSFATSMSI